MEVLQVYLEPRLEVSPTMMVREEGMKAEFILACLMGIIIIMGSWYVDPK
jgi:hypothetical protein